LLWWLTCIAASGSWLNDLMEFDLATNTWDNLTSKQEGALPSPRARHGFSVMMGKIYVFGGLDKNGD
jgi:hypothetical protein